MRARKLFVFAFWAALAFALVMALLPQPPQMPGAQSDKLLHILAFTVLTGLACAAYPATRLSSIGWRLVAVGAGIELLQMIPILNRDAAVGDLLADACAVLLMLLLVAGLRARLKRL